MSKQLLPVYDKPMIYYPLSALMLAGVREILVISTPHDLPSFHDLLGDGSQWGISLQFIEQPRPEGIAQALLLGSDFIGNDRIALVLGDNIFYGHGLTDQLQRAALNDAGATVFGHYVRDPQRYGVIELDSAGRPIGIEEKPSNPRSNFAVTGIYFYENAAIDVARGLSFSPRGELEITDVNRHYLDRGDLAVEVLGRGMAWLDTGTHESLLQASNFIEAIETRQGLKVACLEEIAYRSGWITAHSVAEQAAKMKNSSYGAFLESLVS